MFEWWRERRRARILEQPLPPSWPSILEASVGHFAFLDQGERKSLQDMVQVFVAEKNFEGCGGLTLTDEVRVTIAANACLLLLGLSHDMYRRVDSILVYPSTVQPPQRSPGVFEHLRGEPRPTRGPVLGEAHLGGPVILVWDAVERGSRQAQSGHNVVFHEFAHKLDMLDGEVDGTPPLRDSEQLQRWAEVCSRVYLDLSNRVRSGRPTVMDSYGAFSEAEFFAVATETFFEKPVELRSERPELYSVLQEFYRQDPAERMRRAR